MPGVLISGILNSGLILTSMPGPQPIAGEAALLIIAGMVQVRHEARKGE